MNEDLEKILGEIKASEAVAVGIGSEFAASMEEAVSQNEIYKLYSKEPPSAGDVCRDYIMHSIYYHELKSGTNAYINKITAAYNRLASFLADKRHFIVNLNTDGIMGRTLLDINKATEPCGSVLRLQRACGCKEANVNVMDASGIYEDIYALLSERAVQGRKAGKEELIELLPKCPVCGKLMDVNVHKQAGEYAYDESPYLESWGRYTKWLQLTLNRKLLLVELGVGFEEPSVIRWPFEKIAALNLKARLIRVNGRFSQLPEELKDNGIPIKVNSLDLIYTGL